VPQKKLFSGRNHASAASARGGLHLIEEMLAFLRSVSNFFDTLKGAGREACPLLLWRIEVIEIE